MEEYTKMIAGKNYNPMTPYLISLRDRRRSLISDFNQEKDEKKRAEMERGTSLVREVAVVRTQVNYKCGWVLLKFKVCP